MSYATLSSLLAAQSRKFIHVTFAWSAPKNTELVKPIFDPADDWIRYSPNLSDTLHRERSRLVV